MVDLMRKYALKKYLALRFQKLKLPISPYVILEELQESQYWDRDKMRSHQLYKLNKLINQAISDTEYYKEKINGQAYRFSNLDKFSHMFPKLSKDEIFENISLIRNQQITNKFKHSTSGSTGQPMNIEISGLAEAYRLACKMRFYNWWDIDFHDKSVLIWKLKDKEKNGIPYSKKIKTKLKNRLDLDIFELNDSTVFNYVAQIDDFAPKYIRSYKSGIYELARLMEKHGLRFKKSSIKLAIVTSEVLLEEERDFIKGIFKCNVANEYGSAEAGFYAGECRHGSMHINEELVFISTDNDNNASVTELNNHGTPLINYQNNDRIKVSDKYCNCGRTSRLIENVEGRVSDYILCSNGVKKSAILISYIVKDAMNSKYIGSVKQFRLVQKKNKFLFEFVPGERFNAKVIDEIKSRMVKEIGDDIQIDTKLRKRITREKSGKLRYFIRNS